MINYAVSLLSGDKRVELDSLPVAKITRYPLEKRDYKPYAQGVLGMDPLGLHLRLASFELAPKPQSQIGLVAYLFPQNPTTRLEIWATPSQVDCTVVGQGAPISLQAKIHPRNGEDLQGVYWGWDLLVPKAELETVSPLLTFEEGTLTGNFYKSQKVTPTHYGAFGGDPFTPETMTLWEQMVEFSLVRF